MIVLPHSGMLITRFTHVPQYPMLRDAFKLSREALRIAAGGLLGQQAEDTLPLVRLEFTDDEGTPHNGMWTVEGGRVLPGYEYKWPVFALALRVHTQPSTPGYNFAQLVYGRGGYPVELWRFPDAPRDLDAMMS